ncbi:hypothetical protein, partial [Clostridium sp. HV4-5-A1G]
MFKYEMELSLAFPSKNGINFLENSRDKAIKESIEIFNQRFKGKKQINITDGDIKSDKITITLVSNNELKSPGRELSAFSKELYHNRGFKELTSKPSRLFEIRVLNAPKDYNCNNTESLDNNIDYLIKNITNQILINDDEEI